MTASREYQYLAVAVQQLCVHYEQRVARDVLLSLAVAGDKSFETDDHAQVSRQGDQRSTAQHDEDSDEPFVDRFAPRVVQRAAHSAEAALAHGRPRHTGWLGRTAAAVVSPAHSLVVKDDFDDGHEEVWELGLRALADVFAARTRFGLRAWVAFTRRRRLEDLNSTVLQALRSVPTAGRTSNTVVPGYPSVASAPRGHPSVASASLLAPPSGLSPSFAGGTVTTSGVRAAVGDVSTPRPSRPLEPPVEPVAAPGFALSAHCDAPSSPNSHWGDAASVDIDTGAIEGGRGVGFIHGNHGGVVSFSASGLGCAGDGGGSTWLADGTTESLLARLQSLEESQALAEERAAKVADYEATAEVRAMQVAAQYEAAMEARASEAAAKSEAAMEARASEAAAKSEAAAETRAMEIAAKYKAVEEVQVRELAAQSEAAAYAEAAAHMRAAAFTAQREEFQEEMVSARLAVAAERSAVAAERNQVAVEWEALAAAAEREKAAADAAAATSFVSLDGNACVAEGGKGVDAHTAATAANLADNETAVMAMIDCRVGAVLQAIRDELAAERAEIAAERELFAEHRDEFTAEQTLACSVEKGLCGAGAVVPTIADDVAESNAADEIAVLQLIRGGHDAANRQACGGSSGSWLMTPRPLTSRVTSRMASPRTPRTVATPRTVGHNMLRQICSDQARVDEIIKLARTLWDSGILVVNRRRPPLLKSSLLLRMADRCYRAALRDVVQLWWRRAAVQRSVEELGDSRHASRLCGGGADEARSASVHQGPHAVATAIYQHRGHGSQAPSDTQSAEEFAAMATECAALRAELQDAAEQLAQSRNIEDEAQATEDRLAAEEDRTAQLSWESGELRSELQAAEEAARSAMQRATAAEEAMRSQSSRTTWGGAVVQDVAATATSAATQSRHPNGGGCSFVGSADASGSTEEDSLSENRRKVEDAERKRRDMSLEREREREEERQREIQRARDKEREREIEFQMETERQKQNDLERQRLAEEEEQARKQTMDFARERETAEAPAYAGVSVDPSTIAGIADDSDEDGILGALGGVLSGDSDDDSGPPGDEDLERLFGFT
eukprot:TRINITY_DN8370_c0_g1_i2.p1 TRINITY_DN8370_c0_g1~~TRINITY_DN8370_c0_g1_i2.p1  ORF type:complete len:1089 (+),score=232.27 TRINITY_DN8370_c0_g1_i2:43-3267(+)